MPRGNSPQTKVHYGGTTEDFVIYVDSAADVEAWKKDRSIPLAQVVSGFKIFVTHKHGAQGVLDTASQSSLANEFGTGKEDEVITRILEKGTVQTSEVRCPMSCVLSRAGGGSSHDQREA